MSQLGQVEEADESAFGARGRASSEPHPHGAGSSYRSATSTGMLSGDGTWRKGSGAGSCEVLGYILGKSLDGRAIHDIDESPAGHRCRTDYARGVNRPGTVPVHRIQDLTVDVENREFASNPLDATVPPSVSGRAIRAQPLAGTRSRVRGKSAPRCRDSAPSRYRIQRAG